MPSSSSESVISITINYQQFDDNKLFRLKKSTRLRIVPGESLLGRNILVQTNYSNANYIRDEFHNLSWCSRDGDKVSDTFVTIHDIDMYCEIEFNQSGSYKFQLIEDGNKSPCGSIYCQVEPQIHVGKFNQILKLEEIRCQTVLSKCLGPLSSWNDKLKVSMETGYNLIHFTPIQELAGSRSAYSLRDQLKTNPSFGNVGYAEVGEFVNKMRTEWGVASICDIVLNHTGNESEWLLTNPESTYSCFTCPHLRSAFMMDALFQTIGNDVKSGKLEYVGVPAVIDNWDHIQALKHQMHTQYLPKIKIYEFYQIDVEKHFNEFVNALRTQKPSSPSKDEISLKFSDNKELKRFGVTVDIEESLKIYNIFRSDCFDEDTRVKRCSELFRKVLVDYNNKVRNEIDGILNYAVDNALAGVKYERIQDDGPKFREICESMPLFTPYFTHTGTQGKSLEEIEKMMYGNEGKFFMAHNGWVMGHDPLIDFAEAQPGIGNVYLKRELIAWGDSVKLRYGKKPEDSKYLWGRMKEYVDTTAKYFDGVRLDNCHSTPLHVAEYLIDSARRVNPDLYVVAELFTNSPETDNIFVNRLGITSLIREAMSAWDSHEEGRLVYLYGGEPIGRFSTNPKRPLLPTVSHAILFDQTHDNQSYAEKRSIFDQIPSAAVVSMACCATGSNRGFDELVPHHIHVVNEERQYQSWGKEVNDKTGIIAVKKMLNEFHGLLGQEGYSEIFVDQMDPNVVAITRQHPITRESFILIAHNSFSYPNDNAGPTGLRPLTFEGIFSEIHFEIDVERDLYAQLRNSKFKKDPSVINGIDNFNVTIQKNIKLSESRILAKTQNVNGNTTQIDFVNLRPGSVVAVKVLPNNEISKNIKILNSLVDELKNKKGNQYDKLIKIVEKLNLVDLNFILFSCNQEENDRGNGFGAYDIPNFKRLEYAGLQGILSLLSEISPANDLGHPFCNNLRQGDWIIDYISNRLKQTPETSELSEWFKTNLTALKNISRYLIPAYFDVIITQVYDILIQKLLNLMPAFIKNGSSYAQLLSIASLQFLAPIKSSRLPDLSPNISDPKPPKLCTTLAAGLEHFATGYMRCWGRDTFIALRGLTLLTGRYDEARYIILAFAGSIRHGLVPNLLDGGANARFNCRDAVWFWLHCITCYCTQAPDGFKILKEKVARLYPKDDSNFTPADGQNDQILYDTIQEVLNTHFQGLVFRERNAGTRIDEHMTSNGFNNQIGINPETGFVFGGNDANCGTWMDKMGSSMKAKNKGIPSSPRDGSAVELIGLQFAVLKFLNECPAYPYKSVQRKSSDGTEITWTFAEWTEKIKNNFEAKFFVSEKDDSPLVHKRNIYKDTLGSSRNFTDYQLRCNFPISIVVAPEIFNPENAWKALETTKNKLVGPLGMKTLDPGKVYY